jgi:prephenate dehydrogenase
MEVDFLGQPDGDTSQAFRSLRVAIVGMGLMGGSLALALRGQCAELLGVDTDADTIARAKREQVTDRVSSDPATLLPQADLVILAAPACAILDLLADLPDLHPGGCIVMDLGSTKRRIVEAMESLPKRFDPLGAHPICGKETNGLAYADGQLYQGAPLILSPLVRTSPRALEVAKQLARAIGANPIQMDSAEHDARMAATSHLPYLLASALARATPVEAAPLVGPGFRGTTRLAASSTAMMLDILRTNRENVLASLVLFHQALGEIESKLDRQDWGGLEADLLACAAARETLLSGQQGGTQ